MVPIGEIMHQQTNIDKKRYIYKLNTLYKTSVSHKSDQ